MKSSDLKDRRPCYLKTYLYIKSLRNKQQQCLGILEMVDMLKRGHLCSAVKKLYEQTASAPYNMFVSQRVIIIFKNTCE